MAKAKKDKKGKEPEALTQYRIYKSGTSLYQQPFNPSDPSKPLDPSKPFTGWRRHDGVGFEDLVQARYVSLKTYKDVRKDHGTGKKAIKYVFNTANNIDYFEIEEGIILSVRKDKKLWNSSLVERIEPGLDGNPIMEKVSKKTPDDVAMDVLTDQLDIDQGGTEIGPSPEDSKGDLPLAESTPDSQK